MIRLVSMNPGGEKLLGFCEGFEVQSEAVVRCSGGGFFVGNVDWGPFSPAGASSHATGGCRACSARWLEITGRSQVHSFGRPLPSFLAFAAARAVATLLNRAADWRFGLSPRAGPFEAGACCPIEGA
jgi:hypothetical protein